MRQKISEAADDRDPTKNCHEIDADESPEIHAKKAGSRKERAMEAVGKF